MNCLVYKHSLWFQGDRNDDRQKNFILIIKYLHVSKTRESGSKLNRAWDK